MWDDTPYLLALTNAAHASVRADARLQDYLRRVVMNNGLRRPEFAHLIASELADRPRGFVYDRASGLIFAGGWADHARSAAALMCLYSLRAPVDWGRAHDDRRLFDGDASDDYIDGGHGFLANSPQLTAASGVWPLNIGPEVALTAEEKIWFRTLTIRRN